MLLAIALAPLWATHWWESNRNKLVVALALGLPILALYLARRPSALVGMGGQYLSFLVFLPRLYAVSGGIPLTGGLRAAAVTNTALLRARAPLAPFGGPTGAP